MQVLPNYRGTAQPPLLIEERGEHTTSPPAPLLVQERGEEETLCLCGFV